MSSPGPFNGFMSMNKMIEFYSNLKLVWIGMPLLCMKLQLTAIYMVIFIESGIHTLWTVTTKLDRLHVALLDGYHATVPVTNDAPVHLGLMMHLLQIVQLDGQSQVLEISAQLCMSWTEVHFVWNPDDFDGQTHTTFSADDAWVPTIGLINSVGTVRDEHWEQFFPIMVRHDGFTFWSVTGLLSTSCVLDMRSFPFDIQSCVIKIGNLVHGENMVNLTASEDEINLEFYYPSKQFEILKKRAVRTLRVAEAMPNYRIPNIEFHLVLQRKPIYYVLNMLIPCLVLSMLACLPFMIPVDAGEKLSIAITVLLAFSVFLIVLGDITPKTSEQVPMLSVYLAAIMVVTGLSLFCTVATLNIHYRDPASPMPALLEQILLVQLGGFMRMTDDCCVKTLNLKSPAKQLSVEAVSKTDIAAEVTSSPYPDITTLNSAGIRQMSHLASIADDVRQVARSVADDAEEGERGKKWILAARILDRVFLYIYLVIILFSTAGMIIIYPIIKM